MKAWLHFIGRQYYSRTEFVKEAKKYGITRRVSLKDLKKMDWGDMVLLAMKDGKSPCIFGSFSIEKLSGLSPAASAAVRKVFDWELVSPGGTAVERGCGSYTEGPCFVLKRATLPQIAQLLEELKLLEVDIGLPMIGGEFKPHMPVRLRDIPFRQGFRLFDYDRLVKEAGPFLHTSAKAVTVRGQFYVKGPIQSGERKEGQVQEVANYRCREVV